MPRNRGPERNYTPNRSRDWGREEGPFYSRSNEQNWEEYPNRNQNYYNQESERGYGRERGYDRDEERSRYGLNTSSRGRRSSEEGGAYFENEGRVARKKGRKSTSRKKPMGPKTRSTTSRTKKRTSRKTTRKSSRSTSLFEE